MKKVAEEHMYRHVNLSNHQVRTALFLRTLQQRPELGSLIESIAAYKRPVPLLYEDEPDFSSMQEIFREILLPSLWTQSLSEASRLRAIDVTLDSYGKFQENPEPYGRPVRHLTSASDRLQTLAFHWWTYSKSMYEPRSTVPYADIARLLGYHTSLTHLEITGLRKIDPLLRTDLPNLHTIKAYCKVVAAIVPGRPIQSVTALHYDDPIHDEIDIHAVYSTLTKSTALVTYLKVDLGYSYPLAITAGILMQYLARALPYLEHLAFESDWGYYTTLDETVRLCFIVLSESKTHTCVELGLCSYCQSRLPTNHRVFICMEQ